LQAGDKITAARIALLGATGISTVKVGRNPTVALFATGSELRESGTQISPGQIYESNRLALAALITSAGGIPQIFPLVRDDLASTRASLESAFAQCDIVVTSGGVSVGEMDFVKQAFEDAGGKLEFWKVAIKPGRPFVYGQRKEKFLFGLPGNPVSAFVTFLLLVRPALLRWQGASDVNMSVSRGELAEPINNQGSRRHFVRVRMASDGKVHSAGVQASHMFSSLAGANGLMDVPPDTTLAAGTLVSVWRWDDA
jgi:molybdopterin molybdotransferase